MKNIVTTFFISLSAFASQNPSVQQLELSALAKKLDGKGISCTSSSRDTLALDLRAVKGKWELALDGDFGSVPADMDAISLGDKLTINYTHDEGFGIFVAEMNSDLWANQCFNSKLIVNWEPAIEDEDNAVMDNPLHFRCCLKK